MAQSKLQTEMVQHLAQQLSRMERSVCSLGELQPSDRPAPLGTGIAPLDAILPGGGLVPGTLVEWLSPAKGSGAEPLMFQMAAQAMQRGGNLVVVDPTGEFYPPTADCWGIALQRTVVVHPANERDMFWAFEQALRCPGVAVAVCTVSQLNDRVFRRLQLAAEQGGGLGLLLRAARFRDQPSWADVRLNVTPSEVKHTARLEPARLDPADPMPADQKFVDPGRRMLLELLRCRGQGSGRRLELELNDETGAVRLVAKLATPKVVRRATGA